MAEDIVNVALHPALKEAFVAWLDSKGLDLSPPIPDGAGDTFHVVTPRSLPSVVHVPVVPERDFDPRCKSCGTWITLRNKQRGEQCDSCENQEPYDSERHIHGRW